MYQPIVASFRKIATDGRRRQTPASRAIPDSAKANDAVEIANPARSLLRCGLDMRSVHRRSIIERGWQPIAIGHRADESGAGANSPVVGMRKIEALLGT
jgi:hypothetical protein